MKSATALLCLVFTAGLAACGSSSVKTDERLSGVWVSDKEVTLAKIRTTTIPKHQMQFLRENLGQLQLCFMGNKTAAFFPGTTKSEIELATYRVTESTPSSATVETSRGITQTLHFENGCFYHAVPGWDYNEYFCHKPGRENPCG
jgi:hypothetical protein